MCRGLLGAAAMRGGLNDDGPAHDLLVSIEPSVWGSVIISLFNARAPWIPVPLSAELLELDVHTVDTDSLVDIQSTKNTIVTLLKRNLSGRQMVIFWSPLPLDCFSVEKYRSSKFECH